MASSVLTQGTAQKSAGDKVRFAMDFGNDPLIIKGYTITAYTVTVTGSGSIAASDAQLDYAYQVSALIQGGLSGTQYEVVFTITLNDPNASQIVRTGLLEVK